MRSKGIERQLRNYLKENYVVQEHCREFVFNAYLIKNDHNIEDALDNIRGDIMILEENERYERCALLNDILKDFE